MKLLLTEGKWSVIDYNGQVLLLCPWPAVYFSSPILSNLKINDRRVKWPLHSPLLNGIRRRPTRQGAILVPNSRLARGNGLYHTQLSASVSRAKGDNANNTTWICLLDSGQRFHAFTSRFHPGHEDKAACTESKQRAQSEALYPCRQTDNPPTSPLAAWSNIYHLTCDLKVTAGQSAIHHHTRDNLILSSRCTPFFLLGHEGDPVRWSGRWNPITS